MIILIRILPKIFRIKFCLFILKQKLDLKIRKILIIEFGVNKSKPTYMYTFVPDNQE